MNRYRNIQVGKTPKGNRYTKNPIYPSIEETLDDIYVETTANPGKLRRDSYVCPAGLQIRIPLDPSPIIANYERINRNR